MAFSSKLWECSLYCEKIDSTGVTGMIRGATFPIHLSPWCPQPRVFSINTNYEHLDPKNTSIMGEESTRLRLLASYLKFSQSSLDKIQRYFQKIGRHWWYRRTNNNNEMLFLWQTHTRIYFLNILLPLLRFTHNR